MILFTKDENDYESITGRIKFDSGSYEFRK